MKQLSLLKNLLPGLLPLLIFIAADEIWGTTIGLYVAIGTGVVELTVIYIMQRKLEKFVLFDTLLIVALGCISLLLENEIFFKLKPGIVGIILCSIIGISAFSGKNIMLLMSRRYLKNLNINPDAEKRLHSSLKIMFWVFLIHTVLVFYAAFFMSMEAWGFISGVLLFILMGLLLVVEFIRSRYRKPQPTYDNGEWVPLVDDNGKLIGKALRSEVHNGTKLLHPVVHLHVINGNMQILLQKRSFEKQIQPGKWDTAVGGHVDFGETIEKALFREAKEELFLENFNPIHIINYIWESEIEKEMVFSFVTFLNTVPDFEKSEIEEVRFWSQVDIKKSLGQQIFTPNFEHEFAILQKELPKIKAKIKF